MSLTLIKETGAGLADANAYAYVRGQALQLSDPVGLADDKNSRSLWGAVKGAASDKLSELRGTLSEAKAVVVALTTSVVETVVVQTNAATDVAIGAATGDSDRMRAAVMHARDKSARGL